ncbi:MAG TPA: hypothetical protein VIG08_06265 [Gemmatimonadales bacterium]|jgi:hypothetical protein
MSDNHDRDDDRMDELVRSVAQDYNRPPEPPREAMWAAIAAQRRWYRRPWAATRRPLVWIAAAAAVLLLGVGIGRLTVRHDGPTVATDWSPRTVNATAYRLTAIDHLSQAETFLTLFRASTRTGGNERLASATARELLASNRLLLDSPAANDRKVRLLLEDLELVLAEIAQLSPEPRAQDLDLIKKGIERGSVLPRLRTAVPAGTSPTQGAL